MGNWPCDQWDRGAVPVLSKAKEDTIYV